MTTTRLWFVDLFFALVVTLVAAVDVVAGLGGVLRLVVAMPLVLFLPGYALVSALYPAADAELNAMGPFDAKPGRRGPRSPDGLDATARFTFSVVSSAAVVPLVALAVNFSPWGLSLLPLVGGVAAVTAALLFVAAARRYVLDPARRFELTTDSVPSLLFTRGDGHRFNSSVWDARAPNVALAVGVLVLVSSVGYAAVNPPTPDHYTEFSVQAGDAGLPSKEVYDASLQAGEPQPLGLAVENHEGESTSYTIVAQLQRVDYRNGTAAILAEKDAGARDVTVDAGERRNVTLDVTPRLTGDDLRLVVYLYRDGAPADPRPSSSYRTLRLSVTVGGSDAAAQSLGREEVRVGD